MGEESLSRLIALLLRCRGSICNRPDVKLIRSVSPRGKSRVDDKLSSTAYRALYRSVLKLMRIIQCVIPSRNNACVVSRSTSGTGRLLYSVFHCTFSDQFRRIAPSSRDFLDLIFRRSQAQIRSRRNIVASLSLSPPPPPLPLYELLVRNAPVSRVFRLLPFTAFFLLPFFLVISPARKSVALVGERRKEPSLARLSIGVTIQH